MTSHFSSPILGSTGSSFGTKTLSRSQQLTNATLKRGPHRTMFFPKSAHIPVTDSLNDKQGSTKKSTPTPKNSASTASITAKYGGTYCGDWIENKREGYGTQIFKSGLRYEGLWSNDKMEGEGVMYSSEGKVVYRGQYSSSKPHGYGTSYDDNGDIYEGDWQGGQRHGEGRIKYSSQCTNSKDNQAIYVGHFENNQRNGQGTITYPNGDAYIGEWLNDEKHGTGRYLYAAKRMLYTGEWDKDQSICGEMRDMTEEEILDSTASAVTSNTAKRGELPPLYLADPYSVLANATVTAHAGDQDSNTKTISNNNVYDISAESLGISEEDLGQLAYAFTNGINFASTIFDSSSLTSLPEGCIPADVRILTEIFSTLGIYASEQEVDNVLSTMLNLQEQQSNTLSNGLLHFNSFATCMATQR